jgi:hypothetical protein
MESSFSNEFQVGAGAPWFRAEAAPGCIGTSKIKMILDSAKKPTISADGFISLHIDG